MAIKVRIPNSGSQTTVSGCIPSSCGNDCWLGFTTPPTSSGCVTFFHTASEVSGCVLFSVTTGCFTTWAFPYPVNSPTGLFAGCISGGSAWYMVTL